MAVVSHEAYRDQIKALLPLGVAWPRDDMASLMALMVESWAYEFSRVDSRAQALITENDPRFCAETFYEWLDEWGVPDECLDAWGKIIANQLTSKMLRQALVQKVTTVGSQTLRFFIDLAKSYGYHITIEECRPFSTMSRVMDALYEDYRYHHWRAQIRTGRKGKIFYHDVMGTVDEPLAWWGDKIIECLLRKYCPAHAVVEFCYIQE